LRAGFRRRESETENKNKFVKNYPPTHPAEKSFCEKHFENFFLKFFIEIYYFKIFRDVVVCVKKTIVKSQKTIGYMI